MTDGEPKAGDPIAPQVSRSRVEQDVLAAYESMGNQKFYEFVAAYTAPDSILICNCPSELLQIGGTHYGLDNILEALRSFFVEFTVNGTSVDDIMIDGPHIVVNYNMVLSHVGTGRKGRISALSHYVLGLDRKIRKTSLFLDNAALAVVGDMLDGFASTSRELQEALRRRIRDDPT